MSVFQNSSGLHGRLTIDDAGGGEVTIGGISNWTRSGDSRARIPIPTHFGDTRAEEVIGVKQVVEVSWSGTFDATNDRGQAILRAAYESERELAQNQIRFYVWDKDGEQCYFTPDATSHIRITEIDNISQSADGFATYSGAGIVVGDLLLVENVS